MSEEIINTDGYGPNDLPSVLERMLLLHGDKWFALTRRMVQNHEDAEDVLQDSVLKMLVRGLRFRSPDEARMYFGRIVCNTAIERYHRRRRLRLRYCPLAEHMMLAAAGPDPTMAALGLDEIQMDQMLRLIREGLERLPIKQWEALRLTFPDSTRISIREAGSENSIPYSTLRHRKIQGLRRLKRLLQKALHYEFPK